MPSPFLTRAQVATITVHMTSNLLEYLRHSVLVPGIVGTRVEGHRHWTQPRHPRNVKPAPLVGPKLKADQRRGSVSVPSVAVWLNRPELVVVPKACQPPVPNRVQNDLVHAAPRIHAMVVATLANFLSMTVTHPLRGGTAQADAMLPTLWRSVYRWRSSRNFDYVTHLQMRKLRRPILVRQQRQNGKVGRECASHSAVPQTIKR